MSIYEDKKLFPLLYKAHPGQLESPFSYHQATELTFEDTRKFCEDIIEFSNNKFKKQEDKILPKYKDFFQKGFQKRWSELELKLRRIEPLAVQEIITEFEQLFQRKTFCEPIDECTAQAWVDRYVGCYETHKLIEEKKKLVRENAWPHVADLYNELIMQLDYYAMDIKSLLVPKEKFKLNNKGRLNLPQGIRQTCERNRRMVLYLVLKILTAERGPVIDNARLYPMFKGFRDKNDQLVYPAEDMIQRFDFKSLGLDEDQFSSLPSSPWDFDRIIFYLIVEQFQSQNVKELLKPVNIEHKRDGNIKKRLKSVKKELTRIGNIKELLKLVKREYERVTAREGSACAIPLFHSVRAFQRVVVNSQSNVGEIELSTQKILEGIKTYLDTEPISSDAPSMNEDQAKPISQQGGHRTYDRLIHDVKEILEKIESLLRDQYPEQATG